MVAAPLKHVQVNILLTLGWLYMQRCWSWPCWRGILGRNRSEKGGESTTPNAGLSDGRHTKIKGGTISRQRSTQMRSGSMDQPPRWRDTLVRVSISTKTSSPMHLSDSPICKDHHIRPSAFTTPRRMFAMAVIDFGPQLTPSFAMSICRGRSRGNCLSLKT